MKDRKRWQYAFYIGDDLMAQGTAREISKQLGINVRTFWWYGTKTYKNMKIRDEKRRRVIIRTDQDELQDDDLH